MYKFVALPARHIYTYTYVCMTACGFPQYACAKVKHEFPSFMHLEFITNVTNDHIMSKSFTTTWYEGGSKSSELYQQEYEI